MSARNTIVEPLGASMVRRPSACFRGLKAPHESEPTTEDVGTMIADRALHRPSITLPRHERIAPKH